MADTINEMNVEAIASLYSELATLTPGTNEYREVLEELDILSKNLYNSTKLELDHCLEADKLAVEQQNNETKLKQEKRQFWIGLGKDVLLTGLSGLLTWTTLKFNIKFGPIGTKDAWRQLKLPKSGH